MTGLHLEGDRRDGERRHGEEPPPFLVETWRGMLWLVAIVSMAFTVGYNWHEITSLRTDYEAHLLAEQKTQESFALREVVDREYVELERQLTHLQTLIEQARDRKR